MEDHDLPAASEPGTTAEASEPAAARKPNQIKKGGTVSLKVSEKGALSVYGLGRFPVTLYKEQWERLLAMSDGIKTFIAENKERLKVKGES